MSNHRPLPSLALSEHGWRFYALATTDRPERERRLRREFERQGIDVDIRLADRPAAANGFASEGAWGCFAGHLACLERARDDGATVAVIAEDDVVLTAAFRRRISSIADQLAERAWSMVYLGFLPGSPAAREPMELVSTNLGRLAGWEVTGTHLYAVHTDALDGLIEEFQSRLEPGGHRISADGLLNEFRRDHGLETLVCVPNLARQAPSPSGITRSTGGLAPVKTAILSTSHAQALVESTKRATWNLWSMLQPTLHARIWDLRARRVVTSLE